MNETTGGALPQRQCQAGVMQDRTTSLANTAGSSSRCRRADVAVATPRSEYQGGLSLSVPSTPAPSAIPSSTIVDLDELLRFRTIRSLDGVCEEMHHGHQFPSSDVKKTRLHANNNATPPREQELLTSSTDDNTTVLAHGFERLNANGNCPKTEDSNPPSGGNNGMCVDKNDNVMRMDKDDILSTCMRKKEDVTRTNTHGDDDMRMNNNDISTRSNTSNDNDMRTNTNDSGIRVHKTDNGMRETTHDNGLHTMSNSNGVRSTDTNRGANMTAIVEHSPQHSRGEHEVVSSPKRPTRAQKKNAKKWLSKRQGGRMPDGAPTTPRENSS